MSGEIIRDLAHAERIARVDKIQLTIPRDRIRVQMVQGKSEEMWGFVWLKRLPFVFRAWPSVVHKELIFIRNGFNVRTGWGFVHVPKNPLDFEPPITTGPLTGDDIKFMLTGLRIDREKIGTAERNGSLTQFFEEALTARRSDYLEYRTLYWQDRNVRLAYGTAVSIACDEKQAGLNSSS